MTFCLFLDPQNIMCAGLAVCNPTAFWILKFGLWSLSSFAFGRTWFPASTEGGRWWKASQSCLKGLKGLSEHIKLCFQEFNEPEWGRFHWKWKRNTGFVTCNTLEKPLSWNPTLNQTRWGCFSVFLLSESATQRLLVNAEEAKEITICVAKYWPCRFSQNH